MAGTFYQQIGANKRNSVLLALIVTVLLGALGLFIGWAVTGDPRAALPSLAIAIALGVVASLFSYYAGDSVVLGVSGAKEIDPQALPQLYNVVQEMAIAANVPMPKIYLIDDTAPNAFATGRDPQHASRGDHDGPAPEARSRGAPGRHGPRAVARPELRHPVLADGRRAGRVDRPAGRLLPAVHVLGRRPPVPEQQRQRRWRAADRGLRGRDRAGHPRADPRQARPAGDQPPARVPGRRVGRRADAQPGGSRAGAGEDRRSTRSRSRSPTGRPSTSTSRTRSRACRTSSRTCSRPTRR